MVIPLMSLEVNIHPILDIRRKLKNDLCFCLCAYLRELCDEKKNEDHDQKSSCSVRSLLPRAPTAPLMWKTLSNFFSTWLHLFSPVRLLVRLALPQPLCSLHRLCGRSQRQQRAKNSDMSDLNKRLDQKSCEDGEDDAGNQFEKDAVEPDVDVV